MGGAGCGGNFLSAIMEPGSVRENQQENLGRAYRLITARYPQENVQRVII